MKDFNTHVLYKYFGHIGFLCLFLLSILFYQERIVFIDTVFQFFKIVNFERFNIEADRYGAFLTQIPLLIGLKLDLGLKSLALIYSFSFITLYYIIFIICAHLLRNPVAGIIILLSLIICISRSFFHPSTETHQAIVYAVLFYAILQYNFKIKWVKYMLSALTITFSFYCHPVALFMVLFILFFNILEEKSWKVPGIYLLAVFVILLTYIKLQLTQKESYEGNFFNELLNHDMGIKYLLKSYTFQFFISKQIKLYLGIILLFIVSLIILLIKKKYLLVSYVFLTSVGFFLITIITYSKGDADVMMERSFMPMALFITIPFFSSIQKIDKPLGKIFILLIPLTIFILSIVRITAEGYRFKNDLANVNELTKKMEDKNVRKCLLMETDKKSYRILCPWSFSFTSIVISSFNGPEYTRTIFLYKDIEPLQKYTTQKTDLFLGARFWLEWPVNSLNSNYFRLPDEPYAILE